MKDFIVIFHYATLDDCHLACGIVIVIDVLRAFTTAPVALSRGAKQIVLVSTVDESFDLQKTIPNSRLMGEVNGVQVNGFNYGNSPSALLQEKLQDITLIQRTTAGTQGVIRSRNAKHIFAASFVTAQATARAVLNEDQTDVTFVITGDHEDLDGDEDLACGQYVEQLLRGKKPDPASYLARVSNSVWGRNFGNPMMPHLPLSDLGVATDLDRYDFALPVRKENNLHVIKI